MTDYRWVSTDGNLNAAASFSPAVVPGATDSVYFDGTSDFDVLTNLNVWTGLDLTRLWVQEGYDGDIGADGNPLVAGIHHIIHQGTGRFFLSPEQHGSVVYVVIDSPNQVDAFKLVTQAPTGFGLYCINGGVDISNSVTGIGTLFIAGRDSMNFPRVGIGSGVTVGNYIQRSGVVTTKSVLGTSNCILDGGLLIADALGTSNWTNIINITGGTFQYNGSGNITQVMLANGTLDMSQDSRAKTITILVLLPGAEFITHNNITVTLTIDLRGSVPVLP